MKTESNSLLVVLISTILTISTSLCFGQCASEYSGIYGGRSCSQPDTTTSYYLLTLVEEVDSARILISNFHITYDWAICNLEDTIFANLNCSDMTLNCESISYDLCTTSGSLLFNGSGYLYSDSIRIDYTSQYYLQGLPEDPEEFCRVYKRDAYVGIEEIGRLIDVGFYPNPASGFVHFNVEIDTGTLVQILDVQGQFVRTVEVWGQLMDLTGLPNGRYFVKFSDREGRVLLGSVSKE